MKDKTKLKYLHSGNVSVADSEESDETAASYCIVETTVSSLAGKL